VGKRLRRLTEAANDYELATFTADGYVLLVGPYMKGYGAGGTIPADGDKPAEEFLGEGQLARPGQRALGAFV